jgi:hypothetical protein
MAQDVGNDFDAGKSITRAIGINKEWALKIYTFLGL